MSYYSDDTCNHILPIDVHCDACDVNAFDGVENPPEVEGVVLPERPKYTSYSSVDHDTVNRHFSMLELLLTVARQEARNLNAEVGHKEEIISEALKTIAELRLELSGYGIEMAAWRERALAAEKSRNFNFSGDNGV